MAFCSSTSFIALNFGFWNFLPNKKKAWDLNWLILRLDRFTRSLTKNLNLDFFSSIYFIVFYTISPSIAAKWLINHWLTGGHFDQNHVNKPQHSIISYFGPIFLCSRMTLVTFFDLSFVVCRSFPRLYVHICNDYKWIISRELCITLLTVSVSRVWHACPLIMVRWGGS